MRQFVIIGCGRFGYACAMQLMELQNEVIVVDRDEEIIEKISPFVTHAVVMEHISEEALKSLGVANADVVIVAISSDFEQALLALVACKNLGVEEVIVKAKDKTHSEILEKVGADKTVIPESESAVRLARSISSVRVFDYIEFDEHYSIVEIVPRDEWVGKSLNELNLRIDYGINVIAINNPNNSIVNPKPSYKILESDLLIVAGDHENIDKLIEHEDDGNYSLYKLVK